MIGHSLRPVPIGRDVVIDVCRFNMVGRQYRNLRQAVQRTHNVGITTEIVTEQGLDDVLAGELAEVLYASHRSARVKRGFSMILDHALEGRYPGIKLIMFHSFGQRRYALLSMRHIPAALVVLLSLEFLPRQRYLPLPEQLRHDKI